MTKLEEARAALDAMLGLYRTREKHAAVDAFEAAVREDAIAPHEASPDLDDAISWLRNQTRVERAGVSFDYVQRKVIAILDELDRIRAEVARLQAQPTPKPKRLRDCRGFVETINELCACGGGDPENGCDACKIYHAIGDWQVSGDAVAPAPAAAESAEREKYTRELVAAARDVSTEAICKGAEVDDDLDDAFDRLESALENYDSLPEVKP